MCRLFFTLLLVAASAAAAPYITSPTAQTVIKADVNAKLAWRDAGSPANSKWGSTRVDLCIGNDINQICVLHLGVVQPSKQKTLSFKIPNKTSKADAFFVRMQSRSAKDDCGNPLAAWSASFKVTGLKGKPLEAVKAAASLSNVTKPGDTLQGIYATSHAAASPLTSTTMVPTPAATIAPSSSSASSLFMPSALFSMSLAALAWLGF